MLISFPNISKSGHTSINSYVKTRNKQKIGSKNKNIQTVLFGDMNKNNEIEYVIGSIGYENQNSYIRI